MDVFTRMCGVSSSGPGGGGARLKWGAGVSSFGNVQTVGYAIVATCATNTQRSLCVVASGDINFNLH